MSDADEGEELEELDLSDGSDLPDGRAALDHRDGQRPAPDWRTTVLVVLVPGVAFAVVLAIFALLLR